MSHCDDMFPHRLPTPTGSTHLAPGLKIQILFRLHGQARRHAGDSLAACLQAISCREIARIVGIDFGELRFPGGKTFTCERGLQQWEEAQTGLQFSRWNGGCCK